ncbi:hypothetical protein FACS1894158_05930 [Betaproteobacteria bacterium]|nr:hypothetical protein FACS1894158_05930 [Betaproteobacteria bacterium]
MRTAAFVDGNNVFYGLLAGTPYKWLNLRALLVHILRMQDTNPELVSVSYHTASIKPALATRGVASKEAQDTYLRALKTTGVEVYFGRHRLEPGRAPRFVDKATPASRLDQVDIWQLEEKETDVQLAVNMYRLACRQASQRQEERIEQIVLVSADTDMIPALRALREDFPDMRIGVILPHRQERKAQDSLKEFAHWIRRHVTENELQQHQFPSRIPTRKTPVNKPDYW